MLRLALSVDVWIGLRKTGYGQGAGKEAAPDQRSLGGARGGESSVRGAACVSCVSVGTTQATEVGVASKAVVAPGNTGIWATWQIGQVASVPGASLCQYEAPMAKGKTAISAAVRAAKRSHRRWVSPLLMSQRPSRLGNASTNRDPQTAISQGVRRSRRKFRNGLGPGPGPRSGGRVRLLVHREGSGERTPQPTPGRAGRLRNDRHTGRRSFSRRLFGGRRSH
jgi:hypothetical protein